MLLNLSVVFLLVAAVTAQLEDLPECVRKCATDAINATPSCSSISVLECICTKDEFKAAVRPCLAACTRDELTTALTARVAACSGATSGTNSGSSIPHPSGTQSSGAAAAATGTSPGDAADSLRVGLAVVIAAVGLAVAV